MSQTVQAPEIVEPIWGRDVGRITVDMSVEKPVRITVDDRFAISDVAELPEGSPVLLGQVALELMDYWIDTTNQRLVGNPEHGGEWMIDQF